MAVAMELGEMVRTQKFKASSLTDYKVETPPRDSSCSRSCLKHAQARSRDFEVNYRKSVVLQGFPIEYLVLSTLFIKASTLRSLCAVQPQTTNNRSLGC
jgi:hypothetical protein